MAGQLVLVVGFILGCLGQGGQNNKVSENQPQFPAQWQPPVASQPQAPSPQPLGLSSKTNRPTIVARTTPDMDNPYLKRLRTKGSRFDPRNVLRGGLQSRSEAIPRASRENIFNVCMGTSNGKCDVVSSDETADAWNGRINTSPETIKGDELYKTFWLTTSPTPYGPTAVFMETPVVTSFDSEIAEASVITGSKWSGMSKIPTKEMSGKEPLRFAVQFNCQKAGVAKMMLQGRMLAVYPATDKPATPKLRKEMVITFQKECIVEEDAGEESPVQAHVGARSDALPGFMVGTAKDQANIIRDGIPMSSFVADSQNPFILADDKTLFTIHLTMPDNLKLRPVYATVADETLLRVTISSSQPNEASILFKCLGAGGVIDVSVVFAFEQVSRPTFFNLKKSCPVTTDVVSEDKARPSGSLITGLNIGTKKGDSNVAENGLVLEGYRTSLHSNFTVEDSRRTYKKDTSIVKFHVSLEHVETHSLRMKRPQVTELHGEETESIMKPKLEYEQIAMKNFFKTGYLMVTLRFNCFKASTGQVLVTFPTSKGTLEVVVQKACSADSSKAVDVPEVVIPGFSVGMSADTPNVVQDGNPVNSFNWAQAGQLAFLGSIYRFAETEAYTTFFIGVGPTDGEDEDAEVATVNFTAPELIISSDIAEAELTGPASDGALLDGDHRMTRISVTFHCTGQGAVLMSVVLPMVPYLGTNGKVGPAAEKDVKFSFIKVCGSSKVFQQGQGGVGITGFSIGTSSKENDVVYNGFPRESYYGQRNKAVPKWDNVIVGPDQVSSALFLSYFTEEEQTLGDEDRSIQFGPPMVTVDSSVVRVELSGPASEGSTLVMNDEENGQIEMDITYECYFQGLAAVTILIPIIPHGVIKATIPKQCEGRSAPVGVRISGFSVGLEQGSEDVVHGGFTTSEFQKVNIAMSQGHETNENMTVFYITNDRPFRATEPLIFAHRPICNPSIDHHLHIKSDDSDNAGLDGLLFPAGESVLKVSYNCIIGEKTPITLTIPLQSGNVRWTWIQNCGFGDDYGYDNDDEDWDWVDYDAYDELDDDYYYDYYIDVPDDYDDYGDVFEDDYYVYANLDEDCEGCAGTLNVGNEPGGQDVVDRGLALPLYSQVGASDSKIPYKIVDRLTTKSTFYVSIPEGLSGTFQEIYPIVASAGKKKSGKPIALPTVDGPIAIGGVVDKPQRFTVNYNCAPDTVGVTSVVIQIPLKPANQGSVVFKVMKMCGKFERVEAFYWTANRILIAVGSAISVCLCLGIFSLIKNLGTVKYAMLPTSEKDVDTGKYNRKQQVSHGIELIEPNPDDSD